MTGPEHYREAERLIESARGEVTDDAQQERLTAQVHATLSLSAAMHNISDLLDVGTLAVRVQS